MSKEFRIFGPPGTGKTTALATKYVPGSIKKFGRDKVMITSFTRAAAREIASKPSRETGERINLPQEHVGTLHQICYHALGQPTIVETNKELIDTWNAAYPKIAISKRSMQMDELYANENDINENEEQSFQGDLLLSSTNIKRNRLSKPETWTSAQQTFIKRWTEFKRDTMSVDFTDLIEMGISDLSYAPGQPRVLYVDEAQDFTPLQLQLCRRWAQEMDFIVLVGDDDQAIYSFTGASPDAFLNPPLDSKYKEILSQSWRVPQKVLMAASNIIRQIKHREPKNYKPRFDMETRKPVKGIVTISEATYKTPELMLPTIMHDLKKGESVMLLGSCSYHLNYVKAMLRKKALPFGNLYRKRRPDWNPLNNKSTRMVMSFMGNGIDAPYWNIPQLLEWVAELKVDDQTGLKRKIGKKIILLLRDAVQNEEEGTHTSRYVLTQILGPSATEKALSRNVDWFKSHLKKPYANSVDYPIKVYKEHGKEAIEDIPKITIGTIHSVKGGEADNVYLFPDISGIATKEYYRSTEGRDSILRVFYVGMTRAKSKLTLCTPGINPKFMKNREYFYVNLY
jgi:superfamily I DNA/RNA helicase